MSVQLGGGTNIAAALEYCETLVDPADAHHLRAGQRFRGGGSVQRMLAATRRMASARVTLLGLGALSDDAAPDL